MTAPPVPWRPAARATLKPGRTRSLERRHPWVFSGALAHPVEGGPVVELVDSRGRRVGDALVSGRGGLVLKVLAWGEDRWSPALLRRRVTDAIALRERLEIPSDAVRLLNAEGDDLPGLVADRYGDVVVLEPSEAAWEPFLPAAAAALGEALGGSPSFLVRRPGRHGDRVEPLGDGAPPRRVVVDEAGVRLPVDLSGGQKTGLFLDQRDTRIRFARLAAPGDEGLNLFAYTGAFSVHGRRAGLARVLNVDSDAGSLDLLREAHRLNGLELDPEEVLRADAFQAARDLAASGRRFGWIVVDPPALARRKADLDRAARAYKDVFLNALRLARPGAFVLLCSCSGAVDPKLFGQIVFAAALDAGRGLRILERRGAAPDHPVSVYCPETAYLKAWLAEVTP